MENQDNTNVSVQDSTQVPFFKRMSKGNFIFFVVSYSIIGILILTTILLAVIPTYTGVKFETTPDRIVLRSATASLTLYADDNSTKDDFQAIWSAYNQSGSPVIIDTLFNGYAGKGKVAVYEQSSTKSFANLAKDGTYSVSFHWDSDQLMTDAKGNKFTYYLSGNKTQITDPTYYTAAVFAVSNTTSATQNSFYLRKKGASESSTTTRFYYTGYANFITLYNAIEKLDDAGKFTA